MDYVLFGLIVFGLVLIILILNKFDRMTKNKHRESAYSLLEEENPNPKEIRETIKGLRLYGGRIRRDKEFIELIKQLQDKLAIIEGDVDSLFKK